MDLDADKVASIEAQRAESFTTRRATVPALEELLYQPLRVLDHGFVRIVDYMGDDGAIVQAARVSYGRGTKQVSNDRGLINYLMRHGHTSPFEMCELKLHLKMPIFVARQWLRHRTASLNEYSARYSVLDREFYIPDHDIMQLVKKQEKRGGQQADLFGGPDPLQPQATAAQSTTNKQGREALLEDAAARAVTRDIKNISERAFTAYERLLGEEGDEAQHGFGIARELARIVLPLSTYTQLYWKIDLHNLLHFIRLRADSHAQHEIRAYADVLLDIVQRWVPLTASAFARYRVEAASLSGAALDAVRRHGRGEPVTPESTGLSRGEWRELVQLGLVPEA